MGPEICTKMLKKLNEKVRAKFPATIPGCSIVKIGRLYDAFLEVFLPQASRVEDQSLQQKEKKRGKRKGGKKSKIESKDVGHLLVQKTQNFDFCARPRQNVVKRDASGKKRKLSSCKCIFVDQIKANLAEIQPQNQQNLQKPHFWRKAQGSRPSFIHHTKHKEVLVS